MRPASYSAVAVVAVVARAVCADQPPASLAVAVAVAVVLAACPLVVLRALPATQRGFQPRYARPRSGTWARADHLVLAVAVALVAVVPVRALLVELVANTAQAVRLALAEERLAVLVETRSLTRAQAR